MKDLVFFKVKLPLVKCIASLNGDVLLSVVRQAMRDALGTRMGGCRMAYSCRENRVGDAEMCSRSVLRLSFVRECYGLGKTSPASETVSMRTYFRSDLRKLVCAGFAVPLTNLAVEWHGYI